jgi:beta-mannosidase
VNLNGDHWTLGRAPAGAHAAYAGWHELEQVDLWLPARVPGNVRADLMAASQIPDLYRHPSSRSSQWVDDHCWWLVHDFNLTVTSQERVHLILNGVDYISDLFLNGHHVGRHEGMFSPQVHDISRLLQRKNRLAVRILGNKWLPTDRSSSWEKLLNHIEAHTGGLPGQYPHRRDTLKCQMSFGWDFAPPLRPMGIWDSVWAVVSHDLFIQDVQVETQLVGTEAALKVSLSLNATLERQALVRVVLAGETFEAAPLNLQAPVHLRPGSNRLTLDLPVPAPRLWWPWDHGHPHLYRLTVSVQDEELTLDTVSQTIGLRTIEMEDWQIRINGQTVYARGANWVPADILPGRVRPADYEALLKLAREANMNMLRVWGGGLREKHAFYDLCDRVGILVWQEFPVACAFLTRYPRSAGFLQLVAAEATAIVRTLRNHPSLSLWCGGNEFSPKRHGPLLATLQQVLATEDPQRPFVPASPDQGDSHNWRVWLNFEPPATYREDTAAFASEFGLQAPPAVQALQHMVPPEELEAPGPGWMYRGANLAKLRRYAEPFLKSPDADGPALVEASQRAQAHGLQIAIEHYRRRKAHGAGGLLIWQLNEPWPAISWALVGYDRQLKPAYQVVQRLLAPQLISLEYPLRSYQARDQFCAAIWIVSDDHTPLPGCQLDIVLWDRDKQASYHLSSAVDVGADSATIVGRLCCSLPPGGGWRITCQLMHAGRLLATNEYDLTVHDGIQPPLRQRLRNWLVDQVIRRAPTVDRLFGGN